LMLSPVFPQQAQELPIFCQEQEEYYLFYAPHFLVVIARESAAAFEHCLHDARPDKFPLVSELFQYAQAAVMAWGKWISTAFTPICLTLYLNNECNLRCSYCYADPAPHRSLRLKLDEIQAAGQLVAQNCGLQQRPFTIVCHGGGEPSLDKLYLGQVLDNLEQIAIHHGLPMFKYIATNGVMSVAKARWLARQFDLIGLSCDGPEAIQARQRPLWGGGSSTLYIEQTARIIREEGTPLHARVTITRQSVNQQVEIADYICQTVRPEEIHVEPVYQAGRCSSDDLLENASQFVDHFLKARLIADQYGVPWLMSGSRLNEIHGSYCQLFRGVLNIIPGGSATAWFKINNDQQAEARGLKIGEMLENGRFQLNYPRINALRQELHHSPPRCQNCFNQYHCVGDCPDHCPLDTVTSPASTFRCQLLKKLTQARLQLMAESLWVKARNENGIAGMEIDRP